MLPRKGDRVRILASATGIIEVGRQCVLEEDARGVHGDWVSFGHGSVRVEILEIHPRNRTVGYDQGFKEGLRRAQELAKEHAALKHYHADENGKAYSFDWAEYDARIEEEVSK